MRTRLFPRTPTFWFYHSAALFGVGAMQSVFIALWREHPLVDTVSSVLWIPLFTTGVLLFRYLYNTRRWDALGMTRLLAVCALSVLLIAITVTILNQAMTLALFWNDIFSDEALKDKSSSIPAGMAQLVFNNTISTAMFVSAWALLYIGITGKRRIREAELDKLRLENRLKEARLGELASQLNPHFLFNSLNNIRFTVHESPEKADEAITALSDILRYSLESNKVQKIALKAELEVIDQYLKVMALQLEGRLRVNTSVAWDLGLCLIPPMSLQPLVENAIKHGIEPVSSPGSLEIAAKRDAHYVVLSVTNTYSPAVETQSHNAETGLSNLKQRLELLYRGNADVTIEQTHTTFSVKVELPLEQEYNENAGY